MPRAASDTLRSTVVPLALLAGDTLVTLVGLILGWRLHHASPFGGAGSGMPAAALGQYLPLLLVGAALLVAAFAHFGLYETRYLLRRYQSLNAILKGAAFWLAAYLGMSLVVEFRPAISRLFVVIALVCVVALLYGWRMLAFVVAARTPLLGRLRRRAVLLGWNDDARAIASEIIRDPAHPFVLAGLITLTADAGATAQDAPTAAVGHSGSHAPRGQTAEGAERQPAEDTCVHPPRRLGGVAELEAILARESPDLLIVTQLDLPRADLQRYAEICEHAYIEWKVIPGAFDIFLSGLRLQTIGRVPVLGVEELAINRLFNRALKRALDIVGAMVGLALSAPVILVFAALIKRESPGGPVFFRQTRVGFSHSAFTLWKLRSMAPDAAAADAARQSTARADPRLLRIGAVLRRWNLDELPQFWNVLCGDMSLVGPRPERPYHVDQLARAIRHYLPRHVVKPGMTGWAQVHGLRGESDLTARVQHDIFYIENWSIWLDVQIILLTFVRWRNVSEDEV